MKESLDLNFGLIIAFLLPGFICIYGLSLSFGWLASFVTAAAAGDATVGSFLFVTLASLAVGLIVSAVRWLVIDSVLGWTGIKPPKLHFEGLTRPETFSAFLACIENHYRYYQYYSNSFLAAAVALACYAVTGTDWPSIGIVVLCVIMLVALLLGARDALKKYYERASAVLGVLP